LKTEIRFVLRRYWPAFVSAAAYAIGGIYFSTYFQQISGFVWLAIIVGLVPTVFTIKLAVPLSYRYIRFHKGRHKKEQPLYKTDMMFRHTPPRLRDVARSTIISVFGIIAIILSIASINPDFLKSPGGFALLILSILPAVFFAPALNIASWIMTQKGVMYESRVDGTRIDMGKELRRQLEFIVGPTALLSFGRAVYGGLHDPGIILAFVVFILILAIPSVIVTLVLLLKKGWLAKLTKKLGDKLNDCNLL
jgi:hypothetical protein